MQRERSALDSFPDLNQGSIPPNNSDMDHSSSWDNMLSPVENRLSNYMLGPTDGNVTCPKFSGWDCGESSSSANNGEDSEMSLEWSSFFDSCPGPDPNPENWSFEPPSNTSGPPVTQNHSSNSAAAVLNLNSNNCPPHSLLYKSSSGHSEIQQIPTFYASSSSNLGAFAGSSSSSTCGGNNGASCSPFTWGSSSCKRKALEGTCGQFYPPGGGGSSSNQPVDKNVIQHSISGSRGNLSISLSGPLDLSPTNYYSENINPSSGLAESSARNLTSRRSNHRRHESVIFDNPPRSTSSSSRNFGVYSSSESRPPMTITTTNSNDAFNQPRTMHANEVTGGGIHHPYPWNGSFNSRGGSSWSAGARAEGVNVRTSRRNNNNNNNRLECPPLTIVSAQETRNAVQDQIDWSFVPRNSLSSRNHISGSRVGPVSSGGRTSLAAWLPNHQNPTALQQNHHHQRLSETAPWTSFHPSGSESRHRRSHFAHLISSSSSSSSDEAGPSSRAQRQLDQRSAAEFLMDLPGEDANGWRSLAAIEGRHRLICQVLTAMRRGVHLQAEDYMFVDPFLNGFAELQDRHRDMRLDVDNMSYEELLALEERIGNVSTGLSEDRIKGSMKQRKYKPMNVLSILESCCICQENYIKGDNIGILDCGHEFHTGCIKQWLTLKNTCPICKMTALEI